ncbi:MAG: 4a-hydroxytetrahydrobiopterin dehydratase [Crocinitomicaceae bacterium]|nr:4a-hydroxytetrahydrobiopterin dehydratase [Crocinitomicaceae bacterium]
MSWTEKSNRLTKVFTLKSFDEIMVNLVQLAKVANTQQHHPDFAVENYNTITFYLWTHDEGKVTEKDHDLAKEIDQLFNS